MCQHPAGQCTIRVNSSHVQRFAESFSAENGKAPEMPARTCVQCLRNHNMVQAPLRKHWCDKRCHCKGCISCDKNCDVFTNSDHMKCSRVFAPGNEGHHCVPCMLQQVIETLQYQSLEYRFVPDDTEYADCLQWNYQIQHTCMTDAEFREPIVTSMARLFKALACRRVAQTKCFTWRDEKKNSLSYDSQGFIE